MKSAVVSSASHLRCRTRIRVAAKGFTAIVILNHVRGVSVKWRQRLGNGISILSARWPSKSLRCLRETAFHEILSATMCAVQPSWHDT
ncbi:hypothetical protein BDR03DRAFT_937237 [Suillus americanus]|nr:hypothetical protein BDR03DRAFT_937237 [Suillus americanus]